MVALLAVGAGCSHEKKAAERFHCPMHPTYISDRPGDCPICGMRLVPIKGDAADSSASSAKASEVGGEATGAPAQTSGERHVLYYRSPMDPRITSPVPAKDEMGMDFVPVYEEAGTGPSDVPGHASVTVSQEGLRLAGIRTVPATRGSLTRTARAVGMIQSDERRVHQVTLKSQGYVERLFVGTTGQLVRKGDPILSIYSPDLLAAQSEFLHARQAAQDLATSDMSDVRRGAEDLLRSARERLTLLDVPETLIQEIENSGTPQRTVTLTAPVSGYVTAKPVFAGMQVEPGTELYTVTDLSRVWIEADFYEYEAALLKVGQEAHITVPYDPDASLTGKISLVYPVVDPGSRTLRVRFETDNPRLLLKPGMYANAELQIESAQGILVPDNAVLDTGDRQLVFVETTPGAFTPRSVRVGLRGGGQALLLEGVEENEPVVVQANFLLDSESRIRAAFSGTAQ
jgi:RND family efflux transporter MFP subunit